MSLEPAIPEVGEAEPGDLLTRVVAVLIMMVTLSGAVFAYLQTQAGNRETSADRDAEAASLLATNKLIETARFVNQDEFAYDISNDHDWLRFSYELVGESGRPGSRYAAALSRAHESVTEELAKNSVILTDERYAPKGDDDVYDFALFYEDQYRPSNVATELHKAHARHRDSWGDKAGEYVTVITVLAVSLFLLGLTLTVSGRARRPFLWVGVAVGAAALLWGTTIWIREVERPSPTAIEAYVDGVSLMATAGDDTDAVREAVDRFTVAVEERPTYQEAYVGRGNAYFELDFANPAGPQGSPQARDDFSRAVELNPTDSLGWGNLGASLFWLDRYGPARDATEEAMKLRPDDLVLNLNRAVALSVEGDEETYRAQTLRNREIMASMPDWLRTFTIDGYMEIFDLAERYRPQIGEQMDAVREDVLRMLHEIEASLEQYGEPDPPPVNATIETPTFELIEDGTQLLVRFAYEGMRTGQPWSYRVYVDGGLDEDFSPDVAPWEFDVPDGGIVVTLTNTDGFEAGSEIRVEIFVEANLLSSGELTIPGG